MANAKIKSSWQWAAYGLLGCATVVTLYPLLWVVKTAFSPSQTLDPSPNPLPNAFDLTHFSHLFTAAEQGAHFGDYFLNSLMVALATAFLGVILSCTAGYAFSRLRFAGQDKGLAIFILTQVIPGVVMLIPLYLILEKIGLLDSLMGLVLCYAATSVPFCTWMLKGFFDSLPKEMEEAAWVDGANTWTVFTQIVLPVSRPAVAVAFLFSFMTAWNEFILAATLLNAPAKYTIPVALQKYIGAYQAAWGSFAAGALLASIPVMLLFFYLQKHLVSGLTSGSVKG